MEQKRTTPPDSHAQKTAAQNIAGVMHPYIYLGKCNQKCPEEKQRS